MPSDTPFFRSAATPLLCTTLLLAPASASGFELKSIQFPVLHNGYLTDSRYVSQIPASLDELATTGANDVVIEVNVYLQHRGSSDMLALASMTEPLDRIDGLIQQIQQRGMGVSLKPAIKYLTFPADWTGVMQPSDPALWFSTYKQLLLGYAQLAQARGVQVLYIGNELGPAVRGPETLAAWSDIIQSLRAVYSGQLSINATVYDNGPYTVPMLPFASQLDFVGLSFYAARYTNIISPSVTELAASWTRNAEGRDLVGFIHEVSTTYGKPVAITEMAYRSVRGFNTRAADGDYRDAADQGAQANLYTAFFQVWNQPGRDWFKGVSFWGWFAEFRPSSATRSDAWYAELGSSVQGKRAKAVLTAGFRGLLDPSEVESLAYVIAPGPANTLPSVVSAVGAGPFDMVILGNWPKGTVIPRPPGSAIASKLIIGYIDVGESTAAVTNTYFGGVRPSWFGTAVPGFADLYWVQFWNPQWRAAIHAQIDDQIAGGYDGIFLDALDGFTAWLPGNASGNAPNPNAAQDMAALLADIRAYVAAKAIARPFYLVGNNPGTLEQAAPGSLGNLDALFNEALTYNQSPADGTVSIPFPGASYATDVLAELYQGHTVFSNDYAPLNDSAALLHSFELGIGLSWVPSVTTPLQTPQILSAGPVMFAANRADDTARGAIDRVNFISAGTSMDATLIGGNAGDHFIGGAGRNAIIGGTGNDTIFAHPKVVALKNQLVIRAIADVKNSPNPSIGVLVNGLVALAPTLVTATFDNGQVQELRIDTTPFGTALSIEINGIVPPFIDFTHFANIQLLSAEFQGQHLSFGQAQYNFGSGPLQGGARAIINTGGKVTFASPVLPIAPTAFGDTRDVIDGGGGVNTVVYRGARANYTIAPLTGGSWLVSSGATAEGPDQLTNVERIMFSDTEINGMDPDDDNDGITDAYEIRYGLNPFSPEDASSDLDNDGLTNLREFQLGTAANAADTDRDGIGDKIEVDSGGNPLINERAVRTVAVIAPLLLAD